MDRQSKILIIGHNDAVENSLQHYFVSNQYLQIFSSSRIALDLLNQKAVFNFFEKTKVDYVFLGSVRSGGIGANQKYAAEFIYENLESQNNVIQAAYKSGVKKLLYFTGSCTYPKKCRQPMKEEYLLTGRLEETSEPYSVAKIAGTKLCQTYNKQYGFKAIVAVPATIYGPGSDMDLETAHVMGAMLTKFHKAVVKKEKEVVIWGTGKPRREFIYVDDFVAACLHLMDSYNDVMMINVGCGQDHSIKALAEMIKTVSGFKGKIVFDRSRPDGAMKKLMDNKRILKLGWKPKIGLKEGIARTYQWMVRATK